MSIVGRRGSSESGWGWSRPPQEPGRPQPRPPLLPLAGGGLIAVVVALVLLAVWLLDDDDNSPAAATGTPTATATVAPMSSPTPAATPAPTATPSPTSSNEGPLFSLALWDGAAWQFSRSPRESTYNEGEAVPFLLRIDRARPGDTYVVTISYDCAAFDFLTAYDRDHGGEPALAADGPGTTTADGAAAIPDDPGTAADDAEGGALMFWGGSFAGLTPILPISACSGEKSFTVGLAAAADTVFLLSAAQLSQGASEGAAPLRLTVQPSDREELQIDIDPRSVSPAQP